ncbi:8945_t:CDS:2 [Funneliformis geosporum]|uniref:13427_t:CDS:1 n=1 Tax=Funneliformis geosporum TaxID=1117311 RepID=A0A9W4T1X6_9GLOM|nr:13427_t:CDS:2 [Funneliformis geosporum]CAI2195773.1 8945_t:CDS:2 [Funneliformis geosporum]
MNNSSDNKSTPTVSHIQVIPAKRGSEKKTSTTNIAGHLRSKHRIIDGKEAEAI